MNKTKGHEGPESTQNASLSIIIISKNEKKQTGEHTETETLVMRGKDRRRDRSAESVLPTTQILCIGGGFIRRKSSLLFPQNG